MVPTGTTRVEAKASSLPILLPGSKCGYAIEREGERERAEIAPGNDRDFDNE